MVLIREIVLKQCWDWEIPSIQSNYHNIPDGPIGRTSIFSDPYFLGRLTRIELQQALTAVSKPPLWYTRAVLRHCRNGASLFAALSCVLSQYCLDTRDSIEMTLFCSVILRGHGPFPYSGVISISLPLRTTSGCFKLSLHTIWLFDISCSVGA